MTMMNILSVSIVTRYIIIHQLHYDVTCNYTHAENIHNSHLPLLNLRTEFAYMLPRSDPRAMFGLPQASNVINIRNQKQCPSAAR